MKRISSLFAIAVFSVLAFSSFGMSSTKTDRDSKYFTLNGRVISVDQKARTLVVDEKSSDKIYLVKVPDGKKFKITFGLHMNLAEAGIWQVHPKDSVRIECKRSTSDHLAQLEDGRQAIVVIAAQ